MVTTLRGLTVGRAREVIADEIGEHYVHVHSGRCSCGGLVPRRSIRQPDSNPIAEHTAEAITQRLIKEGLL